MLNRRGFLTACGSAGLLALPGTGMASIARQPERSLSLRNLHTGEHQKAVYWAEGDYVDDGLAVLNHLLRDHRRNESHPMDRQLLDLLYTLQHSAGSTRPYEVISGYRSPATNATLRSASNGVAKRSLHMQGKAIDIRLPGCDLGTLRRAALSLKAGGVGYYPGSNFLHVDTGRVRQWRG